MPLFTSKFLLLRWMIPTATRVSILWFSLVSSLIILRWLIWILCVPSCSFLGVTWRLIRTLSTSSWGFWLLRRMMIPAWTIRVVYASFLLLLRLRMVPTRTFRFILFRKLLLSTSVWALLFWLWIWASFTIMFRSLFCSLLGLGLLLPTYFTFMLWTWLVLRFPARSTGACLL